jgi:hypothetical protein
LGASRCPWLLVALLPVVDRVDIGRIGGLLALHDALEALRQLISVHPPRDVAVSDDPWTRQLTAPGLPEAGLFESRRHGAVFGLGIIVRFSFGRRDIPDRFEKASIVEKAD